MRRFRKPVGEKSPQGFKSSTLRVRDYKPMTQIIIVLAASLIAFGTTLWFVFKLHKRLDRFMGDSNQETDVQASLLRRTGRIEAKLEEIEPRIQLLEAIGKLSVQKVGFMRFNPFHNTGGDNSFVLALLDHENNGVLVSSLYTRDGVRIYGKAVDNGESRHPLSDEEKKILTETREKNA